MKTGQNIAGVVFGLAVGVPVLALGYAGERLAQLPSAAYALFEWLSALLPGQVITRLIDLMVGTLQSLNLGATAALAKTLETGLADLTLLVVFIVVGGLVGALSARFPQRPVWLGLVAGLVLAGLVLWLAAGAGWSVEDYSYWALLCVAWGVTVGRLTGTWAQLTQRPPQPGRRRFIGQLATGAALVTAGGLGLGWLLGQPQSTTSASASGASNTAPPTPPSGGFAPAAGTRAEVTPVGNFYRVDINILPPHLDEAAWRLTVKGLVNQPLQLSASDLRAMPADNFYATLECISNNVGGDLTSTTWFTGVPLRAVLARAGLQPAARIIKFTSADGYYESLPLEWALDAQTRLCYAMGGTALPASHGFPLRLFTPNRFGMKNPKWITQIEAASGSYQGYWEQRTWNQEAWVQTTSVIDTAQPAAGQITAGGVAYAGSRGIRQVEVQLDGGPWSPAELKPALSGLTWVVWRAQLPATAGRHRLTVRATDGTGALQSPQPTPPHPDGATGYHSHDVQVTGN